MIFVDVGAYKGDAIALALELGFAKIHSFEPCGKLAESLENKYKDEPRVKIYKAAMSDFTGQQQLYNSGNSGASLYPDKETSSAYGPLGREETVPVLCASDWVRDNIDGPAVMKLNCEGSEIAILEDLIDNELLDRFVSIGVEFDSMKVPSLLMRATRFVMNPPPNVRRIIGRDHVRRKWLTEVLR